MDLRKYNMSSESIERLYDSLYYQPFLLDDNLRIGVGHHLVHESNIGKMKKCDVSENEWNYFNYINDKLKKMYDDWILSIVQYAKKENLSRMTVADIGCNSGYFLFNLKKLGAKKCVGFDYSDFTETISIISNATNIEIEFHHKPYNPITHSIDFDYEEFDIVIASTIILHLSDPLYFLKYLGSITKKMLFIFSAFPESNKFYIEYSKVKSKRPFPICFEHSTLISYPLLSFGLKEIGFNSIIEIPYKKEWISYEWYKKGNHRALLAFKDSNNFLKLN